MYLTNWPAVSAFRGTKRRPQGQSEHDFRIHRNSDTEVTPMLGGISIWQLLIVLGIIILIFGTKKLRNVGSDLGGAVKGRSEERRVGEECGAGGSRAPQG